MRYETVTKRAAGAFALAFLQYGFCGVEHKAIFPILRSLQAQLVSKLQQVAPSLRVHSMALGGTGPAPGQFQTQCITVKTCVVLLFPMFLAGPNPSATASVSAHES